MNCESNWKRRFLELGQEFLAALGAYDDYDAGFVLPMDDYEDDYEMHVAELLRAEYLRLVDLLAQALQEGPEAIRTLLENDSDPRDTGEWEDFWRDFSYYRDVADRAAPFWKGSFWKEFMETWDQLDA
jgi:hypothetical protein